MAQPLVLGFEFEDATDAFEVVALGGQLLDTAEQRDVLVGVATGPAAGARRADQSAPLVDAQRLRVHAGQLGRDGNDVDGAPCARR